MDTTSVGKTAQLGFARGGHAGRWRPRASATIAFVVASLIVIGTQAPQAAATLPSADGKKLIEVGWDFPRTRWLLQHLDERQDLPFDGMAFSPSRERLVLTEPKAWRTSAMRLRDLPKIEWGRYTDNFILVWMFGTTEMDWTDDVRWRSATANAELLSKAVAASGAQGVMLDTEIYGDTHPWAYSPSRYPGLSFEDVEAIVRTRGADFMSQLTSAAPDAQVISMHSIGYAAGVTRLDRDLLSSIEYALLPAFVEGMLRPDTGTIIDGDEYGYYLDETTEFPERRVGFDRSIEFAAPHLSADAPYELSTPVFMDLTLGLGRFDRGYPATYSHAWFQHNVYHALETADEYAWVYGERVDWWHDWIPEGALEDLTTAVTRYRNGESLGFEMVRSTDGPPSELVSTLP